MGVGGAPLLVPCDVCLLPWLHLVVPAGAQPRTMARYGVGVMLFQHALGCHCPHPPSDSVRGLVNGSTPVNVEEGQLVASLSGAPTPAPAPPAPPPASAAGASKPPLHGGGKPTGASRTATAASASASSSADAASAQPQTSPATDSRRLNAITRLKEEAAARQRTAVGAGARACVRARECEGCLLESSPCAPAASRGGVL